MQNELSGLDGVFSLCLQVQVPPLTCSSPQQPLRGSAGRLNAQLRRIPHVIALRPYCWAFRCVTQNPCHGTT